MMFDSSAVIGPIRLGGQLFELIGFGLSTMLAIAFVAYLLRCYFQEFRRTRRLQRRKRVARLKPSCSGPDRQAVIAACQRRRASAMSAAALNGVDWHGLHSFIPSRDRITLVWDAPRKYPAKIIT